MKKSLILFAVFFIIDIVLIAIFSNVSSGHDYEYMFLPAIFLEIAIYGSFIIYEISKHNDKKDDNDDKDK